MSLFPDKNEEIAQVNAKNIIANFEKGPVQNVVAEKEGEKAGARPGGAKKLLQAYESKSKPEAVPEIVRTGKRPTFGAAMNGAPKFEAPKKTKRRVLIIFAHMEPNSFNGKFFQETVKAFEAEGHEVMVSDLYAMDWKCPSRRDAGDSEKAFDTFHTEEAMKHAYVNNNLAPEITEEQRKIKAAELIVLQFPIHNMSFPAIMKSWIERVMIDGFAYAAEKGQLFEDGLMKGKKLLLSFTTGGSADAYTSRGINGDMQVPLWVMEYGAFRFFGFDILEPYICYGLHTPLPEQQRETYLREWLSRLPRVFSDKPKSYLDMKRFDMTGVIKPDDPATKEGNPLNIAQKFSKA